MFTLFLEIKGLDSVLLNIPFVQSRLDIILKLLLNFLLWFML